MADTTNAHQVVLTGTRIYTADPHNPWAEALVTEGNRIQYVGNAARARELADSQAEHVHLSGGLTVPGLNDSHIHMSYGAHALSILNLEDVTSLDRLNQLLRAFAAANPDRPWIEAYGLPYEVIGVDGRAARLAIDEVIADRPVFIRAFDWHSAWCNTPALQRAGITEGATLPLPNEVVVDPQSGQATGMLKERLAMDLVAGLIGEPTQEQADARLAAAMRYVNRLGITSVQNMNGDQELLQQYQRLGQRGELSVRSGHYLNVRENTPRGRLDEFAALTEHYTDSWNRVLGIKLFIDGVVESKTAMLLEPYADGSGTTGVPDMDLEVFHEVVVAADRLGMNVATHAIGDRGVRLTLDAYAAAQRAHGPRQARRQRVEHIEVIHPSDIARFAQLGVTPSMQPFHAAPGADPRLTPWTNLVGPAREPYALVWRAIAETGAVLSFGSDWPIVTPDVRAGLRAAVTRTSLGGEPAGGWQPQHCVTLSQALDAYTIGAARVENQEASKGMLRRGMLADITVFDRDLFALRPEAITTAGIALTVVDGRIVHREG